MIDIERISGIANHVIHVSGLERLPPPFDPERVAVAMFPRILVTGATLPARIRAKAIVDGTGRRIILYKRRLDPGAQRIRIFHELYHHLTDLKDVHAGDSGCVISIEHELEADFFAMAIAVPLRLLSPLLPRDPFPAELVRGHRFTDLLDHLCRLFGVPRREMALRCEYAVKLQQATCVRLPYEARRAQTAALDVLMKPMEAVLMPPRRRGPQLVHDGLAVGAAAPVRSEREEVSQRPARRATRG
jgi:Zn-dependent peptidase ImmA (M78 family)